MKSWPCFILALLLLGNCAGDPDPGPPPVPSASTPAPAPLPAPGVVHPSVPVEGQPDVTYALFRPDTERAAYPLILALDPQGDGMEPMERYQSLAADRGWMMAASNRSKNGLPSQQNVGFISATLDDLRQKYPINARRVYLLGFSGGARIAYLTANQRVDIAGVIVCGAGPAPKPRERAFSVYGLVGTQDFNYLEMMQSQAALDAHSRPNWVEIFPGGHAWPPVTQIQKALNWFDFRAMAYGVLPQDSERIANWKEGQAGFRAQEGVSGKVRSYREEMSWLRDLEETKPQQEAIQKLKKTLAWQQEQKRRTEVEQKEISLRRDLQFEVQTENLDYWRKKSSSLRSKGLGEGPNADLYMRVVNYLSLICYSYANQFIDMQDLANADRFLQIYAWIDPPNPEHAFLKAKVAGRRQQVEEALQALTQALDLGFKDRERLQTDPDLAQLQGRAEFRNLLARLDPAPPS